VRHSTPELKSAFWHRSANVRIAARYNNSVTPCLKRDRYLNAPAAAMRDGRKNRPQSRVHRSPSRQQSYNLSFIRLATLAHSRYPFRPIKAYQADTRAKRRTLPRVSKLAKFTTPKTRKYSKKISRRRRFPNSQRA